MEEVKSTKRQRGEDNEIPSEQSLDSETTAASHRVAPFRGISKRQKHNRREGTKAKKLKTNPITSALNIDQSEQNDLVVMVISSSDEEDNATVQRPTAAEVHVVDDIGPDSFVMTQFGDGVVSRYRCENSKHRNLSKVKPMYEVQLSWGRVFTTRAELNHMPTSVYAVYGMPGKSDLLQITRADMTRLHPGRFLNDTLIEFYTRYLLSVEPKPSVKVFSPLFFTFMKDLISPFPDTKLSFEARWERINSWLGGIDIFNYKSCMQSPSHNEVPGYNENPYITPHESEKTMAKTRQVKCKEKEDVPLPLSASDSCSDVPAEPTTKDSATINITGRCPLGISVPTAFEVSCNVFEEKDDLPCILLLDSAKVHRAQSIFAGIRKFLSVAWDSNKNCCLDPCDISSQTLPGFSPPTPIQANDCDCGPEHLAKILSYIRSIFSWNWFTHEAVREKRTILRNVLDLLVYKRINDSERRS